MSLLREYWKEVPSFHPVWVSQKRAWVCSLLYKEINTLMRGHRCLQMWFTATGLLRPPVGTEIQIWDLLSKWIILGVSFSFIFTACMTDFLEWNSSPLTHVWARCSPWAPSALTKWAVGDSLRLNLSLSIKELTSENSKRPVLLSYCKQPLYISNFLTFVTQILTHRLCSFLQDCLWAFNSEPTILITAQSRLFPPLWGFIE